MSLLPLRSTFTINLTQGQQAFVDESDWYELRKLKWYANWYENVNSFYAQRGIVREGRRIGCVLMHRHILGLSIGDGLQVDHINHNTLDNRRRNLRIVTVRGNAENRRDQSDYGVGIKRDKRCRSRPFEARVRIDNRDIHIGMYDTAAEARRARKEFLKRLERR